jgi:phospholipid transport system substrate-binding protein
VFYRQIVFAIFVIIPTISSPASFGAELGKLTPEKAEEFINQIGREFISILQASEEKNSSRELKLRALLENTFDFSTISRVALGRTWKKIKEEKRIEYRKLFQEYFLHKYSTKLAGYRKLSFTVIDTKTAGKRDMLVTTVIARPEAKDVKVGWRVRRHEETLMVLDIVVEDLSMLTTQRSEYSSVIKNHGLDGLMSRLRSQNAHFKSLN